MNKKRTKKKKKLLDLKFATIFYDSIPRNKGNYLIHTNHKA